MPSLDNLKDTIKKEKEDVKKVDVIAGKLKPEEEKVADDVVKPKGEQSEESKQKIGMMFMLL